MRGAASTAGSQPLVLRTSQRRKPLRLAGIVLALLAMVLPAAGQAQDRPVAECIAVFGQGGTAGPAFDVASQAVHDLVAAGSAAELPLRRALQDPNRNVRMYAATALGRMRSASAVPALLKLLDDPEHDVRATAAEALGRTGGERVVGPLLRQLQRTHEMDQRSAAVALGALRCKQAVAPLLRLLNSESWEVRWRAAVALGQIADQRAWAALGSRTRDPNRTVAAAASWAFGVIAGNPDFKELRRSLAQTDAGTVWASCWVLGVIGSPEAVRLLEEARLQGTETAREASGSVLTWLTGSGGRRGVTTAAGKHELPAMDLEDRWLDRYGKLSVEATQPFDLLEVVLPVEPEPIQRPRLFRLGTETLVLVFTESGGSRGRARALVSADDGRTWEAWDLPVADLSVLTLTDKGDLLAWGRHAFRGTDDVFTCLLRRAPGLGQEFGAEELARLVRSADVTTRLMGRDDAAALGSAVSRLSGRTCSVFHGRVLQHVDGAMLAVLQTRYEGDANGRSVCLHSTNRGKRWHTETTIAGDGFVDPALSYCADRSLVCMMRAVRGDQLVQAWSTDGGKTWMEPIRTGSGGVAPDLCLMQSGVLACVYTRNGVRVKFSINGSSRRWTDRIELAAGPQRSVIYATLCEVEPGRLLVVYAEPRPEADGAERGVTSVLRALYLQVARVDG